MSFLQIFTLSASLVTIFAFIVGIFSVYNGRATRKEITRLINTTTAQTQELIRTTTAQTHQMLGEIQRTLSEFRQILNKVVEILDRMDARLERIEKSSGSP